MRIVHVLDHSLPLQSGYVSRTLGILKAQRARGWQTFHVTSPRQNIGGLPVESVGEWQFYRTQPASGFMSNAPVLSYVSEMRMTYKRLMEVAADLKPDIIHAHSPVLNGLPALFAARKLGLPLVYEVRATWEDAAVEAGTDTEGSVRYRLSRALESYVLRRADAVTVLCQGVKDEIARRGVPDTDITLIPNSVDLERFTTDRVIDELLVQRFKLQGRIVMGFVGSFYDYEGLDILLRALPEVRRTMPAVKLLLVGGGPQDGELKNLAQSLNVEDHVKFTGRVNFEDINRYYDLIDVFVYPRRKRRLTDLVTPLKPLEAMAKARPVLASDCGGHRELVDDGRTGILFQADNPGHLAKAMISLASEPARWHEMGQRARNFVETTRTWTASAANYVDVYDRVLKPKLRRSTGL